MSEDRRQKSEDRSQKTEVRSLKSEVRSLKSEVRGLFWYPGFHITGLLFCAALFLLSFACFLLLLSMPTTVVQYHRQLQYNQLSSK